MEKTTKYFSKPLFKQDMKSNWVLILVILIIMIMMCNVINFAMSMMSKEEITDEMTEAQETLYGHLYIMAGGNAMAGADIFSLEDFKICAAEDDGDAGDGDAAGGIARYESLFDMASQQSEEAFSVEALEDAIGVLEDSNIGLDVYLENFEYVYAMSQTKGVFTGNDLDLEDMMASLLEMSGMSTDLIESMSKMDTTSMLNEMYFHVVGLLPIFLLIVIIGNSLIVGQVDRGSLAYTLSTPTRRSAVVITQAVFMIVIPLVMIVIVGATRVASTKVLFGEACIPRIATLYLGMYLIVEAVSGLCYLGSCVANRSRNALAFGGGLAVWFFIAALMGLFGSENMVTMGIGVEELSVFNKLTLISLVDINAIETVGTANVDTSFVWKLAVLGVIAAVSYIAGGVRFCKKDLPL